MGNPPENFDVLERERISKLSNNALFLKYSEMCGGDDYDGCFTKGGEITMIVLKEELVKRLIAVSFLPADPWS